jgi:lysophospholipase L1-like esterase
MKKTLVALSLVAFFTAAPATAQVDLSRYVALGDSGSAGFVSGSLMNFYQQRAFPALLAEQAGVSGFELPTVSEPGIPPILELVHLVPSPVIAPVAPFEESGLPTNALFPGIYNNLAVPGATLYDMLFTTGDIYNLIAGNFDDPMHDLILRNGINTALEQGIGLQPTFVTVWIGLNDILPTALTGTPIEGVTMTPVESFEMLYNNAIGALMTNTSADIVLINLPDITTMPFSTSVAPFVEIPGMGIVPLMGTNGPLSPDSLVTLPGGSLIAMGYGLPGGPPLPEDLNFITQEPGYVLRPGEVETIDDRVAAFNQIIDDVADAYGLPVLDMNTAFAEIVAGDGPIFGGVELTADFLLGGIFSYDGIHPQRIGQALIAGQLIDLINAEYGADIPQLNMAEILFEGDWQTPGISPAAAKRAVMSTDAHKELLKILVPKLKRSLTTRRPEVRRRNPGTGDVRRAPALRR